MKTLCLIALIAATAGTAARAEPDTNAAPQLMRLTDIYADSAFFDGNARTATYRGHVRVINPDLKLSCGRLIADLPQSGGHLDHVVAETNVVIDAKDPKGEPVHVTASKAVYDYSVHNGVTNETVTLTGNPQPRVVDAQGIQSADVIVWNCASNSYSFSGNYHLAPNTNSALPETTAPATTNELTPTKLQLPPGADTNYPPGSLDLVPPSGVRGGRF